MTRRRQSVPSPARQRRSSRGHERTPSAAVAVTPLGFAAFRLVPLGPNSAADGSYAPMRVLETRGAISAFSRPRPR